MNQDAPQDQKLSVIYEKMAGTPIYQGRKPQRLHDRGLDDNTPLHVAVLANDLEAGKILLEAGANPNASSKNSDKPLHLAIKQRNYDFVQLLLSYAASRDYQNEAGLSPADLVRQSNDQQLKTVFDSRLDSQLTPAAAGVLKQMEAGEYIAPVGVKLTNVNARGVLGDTPLHIAVVWGLDTAKVLLAAGANPNLPGEYDFTPLHSAVKPGNYEMVKLLLEYGASKNLLNEWGFTPMDYAKRSGDEPLIELLSAA